MNNVLRSFFCFILAAVRCETRWGAPTCFPAAAEAAAEAGAAAAQGAETEESPSRYTEGSKGALYNASNSISGLCI